MPAGLLVTVPFPPPDLFKVNVTRSGGAVSTSNCGNAVKSLSSVMVQGPVPPHLGPFQPENVEPAAGVGVKVTTVPVGKLALQVPPPPQLMPVGALVTVPDPEPVLSTVRVDIGIGTTALKIAVTV